jgi:hypothetical protein
MVPVNRLGELSSTGGDIEDCVRRMLRSQNKGLKEGGEVRHQRLWLVHTFPRTSREQTPLIRSDCPSIAAIKHCLTRFQAEIRPHAASICKSQLRRTR